MPEGDEGRREEEREREGKEGRRGGREKGRREEKMKGEGEEGRWGGREREMEYCYLHFITLTDCHVTYQSHLCACNGTTAVNVESSTGIGLGKFVLLLSIVHMGHSIPADGDRKGREVGEGARGGRENSR